jgi:RNA polymerase sigma factor (sigma-70 family)
VDNAEQVAALYRQHVGAARAVAVAITSDPVLADDIVHDAFMRCASRLGRLRDPEKFRAYLLRAVIRTSASHFRRRKLERRSIDRLASRGPSEISGGEVAMAAELVAALRQLPVRQRTAVAARFLLDMSEAQTAAVMGCRVGTVKSLTSRGLAGLRVSLREKEGALGD